MEKRASPPYTLVAPSCQARARPPSYGDFATKEPRAAASVSSGCREADAVGLINWIFDFYQQYRIDELQRDTAQARAEA